MTLTLHVVRWGEGRMMFKLIAVTDAGDISGEAFLRTGKSFVTTCVIELLLFKAFSELASLCDVHVC